MSEENLTQAPEETKELSGEDKEKKMKNLVSLAILLGGLFLGSLMVDMIQLVKGEGFSSRKLQKVDVVESSGKTWVAFTDPIVKVQAVTDDSCEACNPDEVLVWLRRVVPTISASKVAIDSEEGKKLVADFKIKTIPALVFSSSVEKTDFFAKAGTLFTKKDSQYLLNTTELGVPTGKYLELPTIDAEDLQVGKAEAKVKIVEFSDFQCPYCQMMHNSVRKLITEYGDKIHFAYKHLPLAFHTQAENAALATECANEQGKFLAYADRLFASQAEWGKVTGTQKFKDYARQLGVNAVQFNKCLDDKKYQDKVNQDKAEAGNFGISGTPAIFINDQFKNGVDSFENLKKLIDEQLAK